MKRNYDPQRRYGCLGLMAYLITVPLLILLLCGCTRQVYVPVETVHTEYRDLEKIEIVADTVRDLRFVWLKGDTVVDIREKERIHIKEVHDTCFVEHTDTITRPYPVERPLTRWQKIKMDIGGIAIGALLIALAAIVVWLIKRFR